VLELLWLLLTTVLAWVRPRQDLVLENLLLRHQLAILTDSRPTAPTLTFRIRYVLGSSPMVGVSWCTST